MKSILVFVLIILVMLLIVYFPGKRKGKSKVPPDELSEEIRSWKLPKIPDKDL